MVRKNFIIEAIILLVLWFLQLTLVFQTNLNAWLNLPLLYILFLIAVSYRQQLWWLVIILGLLTEIYTYNFFGLQLVIILVVCWLTYIMLYYLFTNRTFFSFLLSIISGLTIYKFAELLLYYFTSNILATQAFAFSKQIGFSLLVELVLIVVFLFITRLFFSRSHE
jgi:hypothetical protein